MASRSEQTFAKYKEYLLTISKGQVIEYLVAMHLKLTTFKYFASYRKVHDEVGPRLI